MRFVAKATRNSAVDYMVLVKRKRITLEHDLAIVTRVAQGIGRLRFRLPFLPIHGRAECTIDAAAVRSTRSSGVVIGVAIGAVDS